MTILKDALKNAVQKAVLQLPWGARKAAWDVLDQQFKPENILVLEAQKANVSGFVVKGSLGTYQTGIHDSVMLPIYARTGTWATRTNAELATFFGDAPGTYLDIGANIGLTTVPIAHKPAVQCIAFEPEPENFANLQANVARNGVADKVTCHQVALFDKAGMLAFGLSSDNMGDHRLVQPGADGRTMIEVKAMRLDDVGLELKGRVAAKIDVQGAEAGVIAGGKRVLSQASFIIMEFCPFMISRLGGSARIITDFLRGFDQVAIVPGEDDSELEFRSATDAAERLEAFFNASVGREEDFLDVYAMRGRPGVYAGTHGL